MKIHLVIGTTGDYPSDSDWWIVSAHTSKALAELLAKQASARSLEIGEFRRDWWNQYADDDTKFMPPKRRNKFDPHDDDGDNSYHVHSVRLRD